MDIIKHILIWQRPVNINRLPLKATSKYFPPAHHLAIDIRSVLLGHAAVFLPLAGIVDVKLVYTRLWLLVLFAWHQVGLLRARLCIVLAYAYVDFLRLLFHYLLPALHFEFLIQVFSQAAFIFRVVVYALSIVFRQITGVQCAFLNSDLRLYLLAVFLVK